MVMTAAGFWWEPPVSLTAILRRTALLTAFETAVGEVVEWRRSRPGDWPPDDLLTADFRHARQGEFAAVAETDTRRLFLAPRGWGEQPNWTLAESELDCTCWRPIGNFEPLPSNWLLPRQETQNGA